MAPARQNSGAVRAQNRRTSSHGMASSQSRSSRYMEPTGLRVHRPQQSCARSSSRRPMLQDRGRLAREGIQPISRPASSTEYFSSPSSSSSSSSSASSLGGGWHRRANVPQASFTRCGSHTVVSSPFLGRRRHFFVCTWSPRGRRGRRGPQVATSSSATWNLSTSVKATEIRGFSSNSQSSSDCSNTRFHVVFGWSEDSFYTLTGDVGVQEWRLENWRTKPSVGSLIGEPDILASMPDETLRPNRFYKIHMSACGDKRRTRPGHHSAGLDILVNGERLFNGQLENADISLEGEVGVGAFGSKMIFKDFTMSSQELRGEEEGRHDNGITPRGEKTATPERSRQGLNNHKHVSISSEEPRTSAAARPNGMKKSRDEKI